MFWREIGKIRSGSTGWPRSPSRTSLHPNSLLTGKNTGKFMKLTSCSTHSHPNEPRIRALSTRFPAHRNREFSERKQGVQFSEQGIYPWSRHRCTTGSDSSELVPTLPSLCPLSGVKRTSRGRAPMSAFDPKRHRVACLRRTIRHCNNMLGLLALRASP